MTTDESKPPDIEDPTCPVCGETLDWTDCYELDCDDGVVDLYEEDAIYYEPGETEACHTCNGAGGWLECPNAENHPQLKATP